MRSELLPVSEVANHATAHQNQISISMCPGLTTQDEAGTFDLFTLSSTCASRTGGREGGMQKRMHEVNEKSGIEHRGSRIHELRSSMLPESS